MINSNPATVAAKPVACSEVIPRSAPMNVAEMNVNTNVSVVAIILHERVFARLRLGVARVMAIDMGGQISWLRLNRLDYNCDALASAYTSSRDTQSAARSAKFMP